MESGYEKVRYDRLNQVIKKAVEQTIKKSLMTEQLHKCFPQISAMEGGKDALETARKQIQKYFHSTCFKQFDHIFSERDLERKLDELDEIIQTAQRARAEKSISPIAVDELSAKELIQTSVGSAVDDAEKKLTMIYDQLVLENQQLCDELRALVSESETTKSTIVHSIDALRGEIDAAKFSQLDANLGVLTEQAFDQIPWATGQ